MATQDFQLSTPRSLLKGSSGDCKATLVLVISYMLAVKSPLHRLLSDGVRQKLPAVRNHLGGRAVNVYTATTRVPEWVPEKAVLGQDPESFWLAVLRILSLRNTNKQLLLP